MSCHWAFPRYATRLAIWVVASLAACGAYALQPPTPQLMQQYKQDGTLPERAKKARRFGNHLVKPALTARLQQKLRKAGLKVNGPAATGSDDTSINAPPPAWQGGLPSSGSPKVLVMMVDFAEYPHQASQTQADVQNKFFGTGNPAYHPYESLRSYYQRSSYGALNIEGAVLGWYRATNSRSYYQNLGDGPGQEALMMEAINYFDAQGHDFTQYDNNNDGRIDAFFIKWTGPDNGWANFWWAYQWEWHSNPGFRVDGKSMGAYVWSWIARPTGEAFSPHVDIHETGHLLGLPDLYDYNDSVGPRGGVGNLDMMDGNWGDHNCFSKFMLDWLEPTTIASGDLTLTLNPTGTSQDCVLIMPGAVPGEIFDEYFMVQYRRRSTGNDPLNYPTDGLVVWHIDSTLDSVGTNFLYNNSYTSRKLVRLMEADGLEQISQNLNADAGDFYRPPSVFGLATSPNSRTYSGLMTGVQVDQLTVPGATMSGRFRIVAAPLPAAVDAVLAGQTCLPGNDVIDPGERVTLNISLLNMGTAPSENLTATLQSEGGVLSPSEPQNYGALTPGGPAVARAFSFTADGTCGGTLTATLHLTDGATGFDAVHFDFRMGAPLFTLEQNFDSLIAPALPAGWTATVGSGTPPAWKTVTGFGDTAPNAAYAPAVATVADNYLISPSFAITTGLAELTFRHRYDFENGFDGGVLEVSVGDGAFVDILVAGGSFQSGGYNSKISTFYSNPISGRSAFTGDSGGFITTRVTLPASVTGPNIRLRWRLGTDAGISETGWYVDSVRLSDGYLCCRPPDSIGDFDEDGDVDQEDYGRFQTCFSDHLPQNDPACLPARMDADNYVDQDDLAIFLRCHTAANVPADPDCRELP